jgi:hypothetical protein
MLVIPRSPLDGSGSGKEEADLSPILSGLPPTLPLPSTNYANGDAIPEEYKRVPEHIPSLPFTIGPFLLPTYLPSVSSWE